MLRPLGIRILGQFVYPPEQRRVAVRPLHTQRRGRVGPEWLVRKALRRFGQAKAALDPAPGLRRGAALALAGVTVLRPRGLRRAGLIRISRAAAGL